LDAKRPTLRHILAEEIKMKDIDAAYIAALFDSIGTIKIEPPKKGEISCLYIWITRNDAKLMLFLQREGAYIMDLGDGQFRAKWRDHKAYRLIKSIMPFSKMKREQLQVGLDFFEEKSKNPQESNFAIHYHLRLKLLKKTEE
jgi:hypothetical protein